MSEHIIGAVIAKGNVAPIKAVGIGAIRGPDIVELFLDADERYRWYYQDGTPTAAVGRTIYSAIGGARLQWHNFLLLEYRGCMVKPEDRARINDLYAADDAPRQLRCGSVSVVAHVAPVWRFVLIVTSHAIRHGY